MSLTFLHTGTQTKVVEVALDRMAYRWDADEIHRQHPHFRLSQIYNALAYYYDHQTEMDREIDQQPRAVEHILVRLRRAHTGLFWGVHSQSRCGTIAFEFLYVLYVKVHGRLSELLNALRSIDRADIVTEVWYKKLC